LSYQTSELSLSEHPLAFVRILHNYDANIWVKYPATCDIHGPYFAVNKCGLLFVAGLPAYGKSL
jgi:hypothetical protein